MKPRDGWVLVSQRQEESDIVYNEAATNSLYDAHACTESAPTLDDCHDWTLVSGGVSEGKIHFEATRAMCTEDNQDWPLVNDKDTVEGTSFIAAWGNAVTIQYHGPQKRTFGIVRFFAPTSSPNDPLAEIKNDPDVAFFDLRTDSFAMPAMETWYEHVCGMIVNATGENASEKLHIIAFEPITTPGNEKYIRHFVVTAFSTEQTMVWPAQSTGGFQGGQC
jgi:hypothetical protein